VPSLTSQFFSIVQSYFFCFDFVLVRGGDIKYYVLTRKLFIAAASTQ
jgi:hypothetical protein